MHWLQMPVLQAFDPEADFEVRSRNLPHWRQEGATYFVTFRLGDSLPREKLDSLQARAVATWLPAAPRSARDRQTLLLTVPGTVLREDRGVSGGRIRRVLAADVPRIQDIVEEALRHFHGDRYQLATLRRSCRTTCTRLVTPATGWDLSGILHSWKSFTANRINRAVDRRGTLWQEESYDHIVRDEEELAAYERYIVDNPAKAGLREGEYRLRVT